MLPFLSTTPAGSMAWQPARQWQLPHRAFVLFCIQEPPLQISPFLNVSCPQASSEKAIFINPAAGLNFWFIFRLDKVIAWVITCPCLDAPCTGKAIVLVPCQGCILQVSAGWRMPAAQKITSRGQGSLETFSQLTCLDSGVKHAFPKRGHLIFTLMDGLKC